MTGNFMAQGQPVSGLIEPGPVVPRQPPRTLEQRTKYLSVSKALPGPTHVGPPAAVARGVGIAGECMQDQDGVAMAGVEGAVGFVGAVDVVKRGAAIEVEFLESDGSGRGHHGRIQLPVYKDVEEGMF